MMKNRVRIVQNFYKDKMGQYHNEYHFYTTYGAHYLGGVTFPADGQVTEDLLALDGITKEIAMRYGAIARKTKWKRGVSLVRKEPFKNFENILKQSIGLLG